MTDERSGMEGREGPLTPQQAAAAIYRDLDWRPAVFNKLVWIRTGRVVEALDAPKQLGQRALTLLHQDNAAGPVYDVDDWRDKRLVFLTQRHGAIHPQIQAQLDALDVTHLWAGARLDLPPTDLAIFTLKWIVQPTLALPTLIVVARALIAAAVPVQASPQ